MRFEGKNVLVTGAAKGIGRAICLEFAREGADCIVVGHSNLETAEGVAEEVRSLGRQAMAITADVSKSGDVENVVKQALGRFGKIDILVNNAVPSKRVNTPILETTEAMWDNMVDVALKGTFLCSKAVGAEMIKRKQGKIINIGSLLGKFPIPGRVAYSASKGGIFQLTRSFAVEWGVHNINVNMVSPAMTMTGQLEVTEKENPGVLSAELLRYPTRRANRPEDVAHAVLFLASPEADNITGEEIMVDGGIHAVSSGWVSAEELQIRGYEAKP